MKNMPDRDPISEAHKQWVRHGWEGSADGMALVTSIVRVQQLLMERLDEQLRPFDLSFARYEILMVLSFSSSGAMPMTRLGSVLQVHPSSITGAAQPLQEQGYLERAGSNAIGESCRLHHPTRSSHRERSHLPAQRARLRIRRPGPAGVGPPALDAGPPAGPRGRHVATSTDPLPK